eukprot:TRINITY_DN6995_c0_g1_i1.p1 TRINITY_DN6995_c0_g1~~TRINITY_DN6995_c0_g1_i1.p1  ORF type:complete len:215 (+),score=81.26 TRINITY_DN6995_c0_g1_i1:129-773(+)
MAVRAQVAYVEPKLSRKERKLQELRERTHTKLTKMAQLHDINKANEEAASDPNRLRPRTSLTGFWRKRKEEAKACVFVGNLPESITEAEMYSHFSGCGAGAQSFRWIPSKSGSGACMAYAQFESIEDADAACALDGQSLLNRPLRVNKANDKKERNAAIARRDGLGEKGSGQPQAWDNYTDAEDEDEEEEEDLAPAAKRQKMASVTRNKVAIID